MAKVVGLVGSASGKIGNVVYAVNGGLQIARVYQPVVSNPKSAAQRIQRAKANLIGQISKITPFQILTGLGSDKRKRRARFLKLGLINATANVNASNPAVIDAKLDAPGFVFSEGATVPTMTVNSATAYSQSVSVVLGKAYAVPDEDFAASGCLVVVAILTLDGKYESILYRFVNASDFGNANTLTVGLSHVYEGDYYAEVYIAPFKTLDGTPLSVVSGQLFGETQSFNASMTYNPSALPIVWGNSIWAVESTYQQNP